MQDDIELEPRFDLGSESLSAGVTWKVGWCGGGLRGAMGPLFGGHGGTAQAGRRRTRTNQPTQQQQPAQPRTLNSCHAPLTPFSSLPPPPPRQVDDENKLRAIFDMGTNEVRGEHVI